MATANAAAAGEDSQLSFPLPPVVYFKQFTNENIKNGSVPKPPPVIDGEYSMFGHTQKVKIFCIIFFTSPFILYLRLSPKNCQRIK